MRNCVVENSVLVIVDVQEKLFSLMQNKEKLLKNIKILIQASQYLNIPIIYTEQVPKKLGRTLLEISSHLEGLSPIEKTSFSCYSENTFAENLQKINRQQVILVGIEAHICVYQTAMDLIHNQFDVKIISDAVSSRCTDNKTLALENIKMTGGNILSTEMILFEWLKTSEHKKFREISQLIR